MLVTLWTFIKYTMFFIFKFNKSCPPPTHTHTHTYISSAIYFDIYVCVWVPTETAHKSAVNICWMIWTGVHRELILCSMGQKKQICNIYALSLLDERLNMNACLYECVDDALTWTQSLWGWTSQQGWTAEERASLSFSHILRCLNPQPLIPTWFLQEHNTHEQKICINYIN